MEDVLLTDKPESVASGVGVSMAVAEAELHVLEDSCCCSGNFNIQSRT